MSTDNTPSGPDAPAGTATGDNPPAQDAAPAAPATAVGSTAPAALSAPAAPASDGAPETAAPAFNLAEDMASTIENNAEVLAQRLAYHSQIMFGVGAVGVDVVSARNMALVLATALRSRADTQAEQALIGLGEPQIVQINDGTLPFKNNGQVAGLFEGLVLDTLARAYADNPARFGDARAMLNNIFQPANETMQSMTRLMTNLDALRALPVGSTEAKDET